MSDSQQDAKTLTPSDDGPTPNPTISTSRQPKQPPGQPTAYTSGSDEAVPVGGGLPYEPAEACTAAAILGLFVAPLLDDAQVLVLLQGGGLAGPPRPLVRGGTGDLVGHQADLTDQDSCPSDGAALGHSIHSPAAVHRMLIAGIDAGPIGMRQPAFRAAVRDDTVAEARATIASAAVSR